MENNKNIIGGSNTMAVPGKGMSAVSSATLLIANKHSSRNRTIDAISDVLLGMSVQTD